MITKTCRTCHRTFETACYSPKVRCDDCLAPYAPSQEKIAELTEAIRAQWPPGEDRRRAPYAICGPVEIREEKVVTADGDMWM